MAITAPEARRYIEWTSTGSTAEILGGVGAIVLSVVGLAQVASQMMMSIVTILLGMTLLFEGAGIAADYSRALARSGSTRSAGTEAGGGMTAEMFAGLAGIVLGILALLGLYPTVLVPAAIIVFGSAMVFSTSAISELNDLKAEAAGTGEGEPLRRVAPPTISPLVGSEAMIGLAAVVLGILSVVGVVPVTLSLVALLALGTAELLLGTAIGGRLLSLLAH